MNNLIYKDVYAIWFICYLMIQIFVSGNYTLKVSNTGPAVIDSIIDFTAELSPFSPEIRRESLFKYIWHNDADHDVKEQNSDWTSNLTSYNFERDVVLPNKYRMTVCVYKRILNKKGDVKKIELVASGFTSFELTGM